MGNWRFLRKAFLGIVAVTMFSLMLTGCKEESEHPSKSEKSSKSEHPAKSEKPVKSEHPEHPK